MAADAATVLRGARRYVLAGWTQGALGRYVSGEPVRIVWRGSNTKLAEQLARAAMRCLLGCLLSAAYDLDALGPRGGFSLALDALATVCCEDGPQGWNDAKDRHRDEVLAMLDNVLEAIE